MTLIQVEIPDHVIEEGRAIYIMAGIECIAYRMPWDLVWHVKVSRCSECGLCCQKINCPDLGEDNRCSRAGMRPFLCCTSDPKDIPSCTSKYEAVK